MVGVIRAFEVKPQLGAQPIRFEIVELPRRDLRFKRRFMIQLRGNGLVFETGVCEWYSEEEAEKAIREQFEWLLDGFGKAKFDLFALVEAELNPLAQA